MTIVNVVIFDVSGSQLGEESPVETCSSETDKQRIDGEVSSVVSAPYHRYQGDFLFPVSINLFQERVIHLECACRQRNGSGSFVSQRKRIRGIPKRFKTFVVRCRRLCVVIPLCFNLYLF
jgi:hypothetical protein